MIENELDRLDILYGFGMRLLGIAYSEANSWAPGCGKPRDGGLTEFGRQAVERMNKLGIAIDISHSGDQTSLDTIEVSGKPIFITHAGARALWHTPRMKPDEVLKACAEQGRRHRHRGGPAHHAHPQAPAALDRVVHGALRVLRQSGRHRPRRASGRTRCSATTWGCTTLSPPTCRSRQPRRQEYPRVEYVEGLENPAEAFPNIVRWLVKHGYSDDDIAKVIGGNTMRVLREVWH